MLSIVFNVRYGYADEFMTIKNYEVNLSFLSDELFLGEMDKIIGRQRTKPTLTENELYARYKDAPAQMIKDNGLAQLFVNRLSTHLAAEFFPEVLSKESTPLVFPELMVVDKYRLELTDEFDNDYTWMFGVNDDNNQAEADDDEELIQTPPEDHKYDA